MNGIALIKKEKGRSVYAAYTLCFFAFSALIIVIYAAAGKSFVWWDDGMYQHVNSLAYYGKYLREIFSGFLHGDFEVPMFSLSIGYGADIATTLNYYVFGDPFSFFAVFVPERFTEICSSVSLRACFLRIFAPQRQKKRSRCFERQPYLRFLRIYAFCGRKTPVFP